MSEKSTSKSEQQSSSTSSLTRISSSSSSLAVTQSTHEAHHQESNLSVQLPRSHQRSPVEAQHLLQRLNGNLPSYNHVRNNVMLRSEPS